MKKENVKGWKGYNSCLSCRGVHYTLNKTMRLKEADSMCETDTWASDTLSICQHGLHFCTYPLDVLKFYGPTENNRYTTVVATGEVIIQPDPRDDSKCVTDKLRPLKELPLTDLVESAILNYTYKYTTSQTDGNIILGETYDTKVCAYSGFVNSIQGGSRNFLQAGASHAVYCLRTESSVLTVGAMSIGAAYGSTNAVVTCDNTAVAAIFGVDDVAWVRSHYSIGFAAGPYQKVIVTSTMSMAVSIDHTTEIELNNNDCVAFATGPVHVRGKNCTVVFQLFTPEFTKITCDHPTMLVLRKPQSQQLIATVWKGFNTTVGRIYQDYLDWRDGKEGCGPFLDINKEFYQ